MDINYKELDFLALMPCPLKVPLEQIISKEIQRINKEEGGNLRYFLASNAVMQEDIFAEISKIQKVEDLPMIMLAPGIGRFFDDDFIANFRNQGCFSAISKSTRFKELGISDPKEYYDVIAFNPLVFLVDKTNNPDMPTPRKWLDLLNPCYEKKVAYRGRDDRSFCEGVLLPIFHLGGREAIKKLGASVKCRLHPAEMVKMAGRKKEEAPSISIIPLSFARMVKQNKNVSVVWPEDGAAVNPLVMLVKKESPANVKRLADFMCSKEMFEVFNKGGFYAACDDFDDITEHSNYSFCGWDFIENNSIHDLVKELNEIMFMVVRGTKATGSESGCCVCSL